MNRKSRIALGTLALATLIGVAGNASAKGLFGFWQDNDLSVPNGPTYTTCNGQSLWSSSYGYDSGGGFVCGVRPSANGVSLMTTCPASAATFQVAMRTAAATYCSSVKKAWGAPTTVCETPRLSSIKSGTTQCVSRVFAAFGRGF